MGKLAQKLGGQSQSQIQTKNSGGLIKGKQAAPATNKTTDKTTKGNGCSCGGSVK